MKAILTRARRAIARHAVPVAAAFILAGLYSMVQTWDAQAARAHQHHYARK